jgi:hypothetical protein
MVVQRDKRYPGTWVRRYRAYLTEIGYGEVRDYVASVGYPAHLPAPEVAARELTDIFFRDWERQEIAMRNVLSEFDVPERDAKGRFLGTTDRVRMLASRAAHDVTEEISELYAGRDHAAVSCVASTARGSAASVGPEPETHRTVTAEELLADILSERANDSHSTHQLAVHQPELERRLLVAEARIDQLEAAERERPAVPEQPPTRPALPKQRGLGGPGRFLVWLLIAVLLLAGALFTVGFIAGPEMYASAPNSSLGRTVYRLAGEIGGESWQRELRAEAARRQPRRTPPAVKSVLVDGSPFPAAGSAQLTQLYDDLVSEFHANSYCLTDHYFESVRPATTSAMWHLACNPPTNVATLPILESPRATYADLLGYFDADCANPAALANAAISQDHEIWKFACAGG